MLSDNMTQASILPTNQQEKAPLPVSSCVRTVGISNHRASTRAPFLVNCRLIALIVLLFIFPKQSHAIVFNGTDYPVPADGITDAEPGFRALFNAVATAPGNKTVVIPSGKYLMGLNSTANQISLPSNTTVDASAAQFLFPTNLPTANAAYPFPLAFSSVDVTNLTWTGGSVLGYCFDLNATDPSTNVWKPKETPGFLYFSSTSGHGCQNITVQNLSATNLSGPVVSFNGIGSGIDWSATTTTTCRNLMLTNCTFINCGLFAWDYSYLLQIVCYSNHYSAGQWWMATNYMPPGAIIGPVTTTAGSSLVGFSNPGLVALNTNSSSTKNQCSFYGIPPSSTPQIVAGNPYFIVGTNANGILVSPYQGGAPVVFTGTSSGSMGLVPNIWAAGVNTYFPYGISGRVYSGSYNFIDCDSVTVVNCTWSSPGDSSQFYRTYNILMSGNQVPLTRMGVLVLKYTKNTIVTNNQFNVGTSGSVAISVETASNLNIIGNSFTGCGRGSLILNSEQTVIANNTFRTNTTKAYQDYSIGRIGPEYGGFWDIRSVFEFNSDGTHNNCIVFTNNLVQTDSAFYFMIFNSGWYTNSIISDNIIYGTRIDGSDASQGLVYGYPAAPPYAFRCIHFNSSIARNSGLDMASDGTFCTVTPAPTSQLTFPHHLPVIWPSQSTGLYTNSGTVAFQTAAVNGPTNYLATVTPISPLSPGISSYSIDATNISVNFAGTIPSNTPVTLDWTAQQFLNFGQDADIEDYLTRVTTDGVNLSGVSWTAFYNVARAFKNVVGWSHFIEIYPLWGTGPAYLEKLKSADGEPRLRNVGMIGSTTPPFLPNDFGSRGLSGDGLSKSLQLSLTPGAINSGLKGGISAFVNNSTSFVPSSGSYLLGVDDGVNQYGLQWTGTGIRGSFGGNGVAATLSSSALGSPILYTVSRTSPTTLFLYTNGVLAATSAVSTSAGGSTRNIRLFARAGADNNPSAYFNGTLAFAFIDDGTLSPGNYAYLNSAIRTWLTNINELP
jgi:parallel beta-helix repeat protein